MSRINKVAFKVKGGPTKIKNFDGISSKYDGEKLSAANKKEIRSIAADQYGCKESDIIFSDEYTVPEKQSEKETETKTETDKSKTGDNTGGNSGK